ncbi:MAG: hypothetical protein KBD50_03475 [Candidatus Pacebacteria bacterium]|nr:hypothetical protein [Candidatus Paceibacterota bacterium]
MQHELTIISAYHSDTSRHLLEKNEEFARTLLGRAPWTWIAVDNTPADYAGTHPNREHFQVIKGVPYVEYLQTLEPWQKPISAGFHHVQAIHKAFAESKTRFVLILDGDLYLVYRNWAEEVLRHMKEHQVAMLGTPWHPRWWKKVRYYPIHHALFIDTSLVPLSQIDLFPKYNGPEDLTENRYGWLAPFSRVPWLRPFANALRGRLLIGTSKDASYDMYVRFRNSELVLQTLTPVLHPYEQARPLKRFISRVVDYVATDRLSYTPRVGTYTTKGFKEHGCPDADGNGWEEFMWQGKPFGFHMRSYGNAGRRTPEENVTLLSQTLRYFVEKI